jgi:glycosyltransferase involved in cell wall biosynthesis
VSYAIVTPAYNEAGNLPRLAASLQAQSTKPSSWIVVDDGSSDETLEVMHRLAAEEPWIQTIAAPARRAGEVPRGAPVVRAFHLGVAHLERKPELIAKVDADVSVGPDYFERLLETFAVDPSLGIASGSCYQLEEGVWRQFYGTGANVWGAARAYRWDCLEQILPLEERMGWDGIDVVRANVHGWRTATLLDLPFFHHRLEASRESGSWQAWAVQGEAAHYMGYRVSYVLLRTLFRARKDPAALSMLWSFVGAALRRQPTCPDPEVRAYLRRQQRLRNLPSRRREALGKV